MNTRLRSRSIFRSLQFGLLLLMVPTAIGQSVSARLEGIVVDPSKAVIPGVVVAATNELTNISHEAVSNESGRYVFPNLPPGAYTLTAELPGFKKTILTGIRLQIGDAATQDLMLQTGEITESVTVTAEVSLVNTSTTRVGAVVQDRQALDLPLNGRNAMMLFYLQAGTNPLDRMGGQQQVGVVDGLAPHTSAVKVEGIMASNPGYDYSPAHPSTPVPQEAVGEYRVTTSGELSDAGRGSGAQVKVLIKSGTNEFHGSAFEFNRNTVYNANDFFNNRTGTARPVFRRNQFGFALGGPIIRNKTFFFGTAEWQRQNQDSVENRLVYTPTLRTGLFRFYRRGNNSGALVDSSGHPIVPAEDIGSINLLNVDSTRLGFDTVFLPKLLPVMPSPNNYDLGDGFNTAGYRYNSPIRDDYSQVLIKVDHAITSRHNLAVSYSRQREENPQPRLYNGISPEGFTELRKGASVRLVSAITPRFTNELSVGANLRLARRPITNPGQQSPQGNFQFVGLGTSSGVGAGDQSGNIHVLRSNQINPAVNEGFQDTATWIRGNHTLSFGGEYWFQTLNRTVGTGEWPIIRTDNASNPALVPTQTGLSSTDRSRAQQLTNDLTGSIGSITQTFYLNSKQGYIPFVSNYQQLRKTEWSLFIQDIWKIRPNLSLDLGVRFEMFPPVYIANGVYGYPIGGVAGALGVQGPNGRPTEWGFATNEGRDVFRTDRNNFAPSVGFSWDPFGDAKTAVTGSYRIAYDRFMMVTGDFSGFNYGATTTRVLTPFTRLSDPRLYNEILPITPPQLFAPLGNDRLSRAYVADPNLAIPYVQSWSFGIERQIFSNWKINAVYVGNHSVGMWRGANLNQLEMRSNGFIEAFKIAQANLAQNGRPTLGQSIGKLEPLFNLIPSSQFTLINQGQAAALANFLDTTTLQTGRRGGLLELAGLASTFFRFNPQVLDLNVIGNRSHSTFQALKLMINRRFEKGAYFQANYTLGKALTDAIPAQSLANDFRDNSNIRLDKGLSPLDSTHVIQMNGIWELPIGRGRRYLSGSSGAANMILGGWQINGIFNWTTGRPLLLTTGRNNLTMGSASTPNFAGSFTNLADVDKGSLITFISSSDRAAFTNPGAGETGQLPLYAFHGPGFATLDMSFFKSFPLGFVRESASLQFRAEFFNILNQTSFRAPGAGSRNINSGSFGVLTGAYPARIGQFALKLSF